MMLFLSMLDVLRAYLSTNVFTFVLTGSLPSDNFLETLKIKYATLFCCIKPKMHVRDPHFHASKDSKSI